MLRLLSLYIWRNYQDLKEIYALKDNRMYGMDLLRSIAILLVLFSHSFIFIKSPSDSILGIVENYLAYFGVELFFVLSGFLIGNILLKLFDTEFNCSVFYRFLISRWLRTVPLYLFFLIIYIVLDRILIWDEFGYIDWRVLISYFFFAQNVITNMPPYFGVSWSLSVEEWFYVVFPVYGLLFSRIFFNSTKGKLTFLFSFFLLAFVLKVIYLNWLTTVLFENGLMKKFNFDTIRKTVMLRLDAIWFGVLVSFGRQHIEYVIKRYRFVSLILGVIMCCVFVFVSNNVILSRNEYWTLFVFDVLGFGIAMILPYFISLKADKGWFGNLVLFISIISYSLYLSHTFIWIIFIKFNLKLVLGHLGSFALFIFLSILLAFITFFIIELYVLRKKKELLNRKRI
jgi:peptidoglycan/LPS O-acetylase OafA/YrhL